MNCQREFDFAGAGESPKSFDAAPMSARPKAAEPMLKIWLGHP